MNIRFFSSFVSLLAERDYKQRLVLSWNKIRAVEFETRMINTCILCIIIYKVCHEQKFCLIILLSIDKNLEIDYYCIGMLLGLAIYLRIKVIESFCLMLRNWHRKNQKFEINQKSSSLMINFERPWCPTTMVIMTFARPVILIVVLYSL